MQIIVNTFPIVLRKYPNGCPYHLNLSGFLCMNLLRFQSPESQKPFYECFLTIYLSTYPFYVLTDLSISPPAYTNIECCQILQQIESSRPHQILWFCQNN